MGRRQTTSVAVFKLFRSDSGCAADFELLLIAAQSHQRRFRELLETTPDAASIGC